MPQRPIGDINPFYTCTYQYLYADTSKPYGFTVTGTDKINSCNMSNVGIRLDSVKLQQGNIYNLKSGQDSMGLALPGKKSSSYISVPSCSQFIIYNTTDSVTGQITITFLDQVNQIVSGTFWFDALNKPGDTVHVRNGRFDMHFTE